MCEGCDEGSIHGQQYGQVTYDAIEEPIDVIAFVRLGAVNVLWTKRAPIEAKSGRVELSFSLFVVLLDVSHFNEGFVGPGLVHTTGAHVGVHLWLPCGNGTLHLQRADVLVVEDIVARGHASQGSSEAAVRKVSPSDINTLRFEVSVAVEGRLLLFRRTVVNEGDLHTASKPEGEVVAQLPVTAPLVLYDESGSCSDSCQGHQRCSTSSTRLQSCNPRLIPPSRCPNQGTFGRNLRSRWLSWQRPNCSKSKPVGKCNLNDEEESCPAEGSHTANRFSPDFPNVDHHL
mmetsp:Transcript_21527/g.50144  ORF Transcript_21527/g.50144 Transcript_21527/m.50144 type:complete len:287 (-) Transcript_21527:103-963(-)